MDITFTAHFDRGYIADPYWPARERLITITKESGFSRARSQRNREEALRQYLSAHDMTLDDYHALERQSAAPFYLDGGSAIVLPEHHVYGVLVQAADQAPSAVRVCDAAQVRTLLHCSAWRTDRTKPDGVWERFVVVTDSRGKLSNQRSLRSNPYIEDFDATGDIMFEPDLIRPEKLRDYLTYAGREVGIGASRKMGWGRFVVTAWEGA